jgi:hypothetical protein
MEKTQPKKRKGRKEKKGTMGSRWGKIMNGATPGCCNDFLRFSILTRRKHINLEK